MDIQGKDYKSKDELLKLAQKEWEAACKEAYAKVEELNSKLKNEKGYRGLTEEYNSYFKPIWDELNEKRIQIVEKYTKQSEIVD